MEKELKIKRRKELRECKRVANKFLNENIRLNNNRSKKWENRVFKNNIIKLRKIIKELNIYDKDTEIEKYVNNEISSKQRQITGKGLITDSPQVRDILNKAKIQSIRFNTMRYSPSYSIEHDLHWITDGTVGDQINVALGIESIEIYGQFLENKINLAKKKVIKFLNSIEELKSSAIILGSALKNLEKKHFSTANILIITLIEGLVRIICRKIYENQNPNLTEIQIDEYIFSSHTSLESIILNGDFKPDFEISIIDGYMMSQHVISKELESIEKEFLEFKEKSDWIKKNLETKLAEISSILVDDEINEKTLIAREKLKKLQKSIPSGPNSISEKRKISIKPRLEFLLRTLKEDRNLIIHGKYSKFNKSWKSYLYLAALIKVTNILKEYSA